MNVRIAPSILSSDFGRLAEQIQEAERAGADLIHVDVMDGQFVPNITMGPAVVAACRRATKLPLDVHLMVVQPERFIAEFVEAGADYLCIQAEATPHLHRSLELIREAGARPGLAVNPLTPLEVLETALPYLDLALIMSVNPGFGGQKFIGGSLARLEQVRRWRERSAQGCLIEVDGGINRDTAGPAYQAGADILVAGSAVFNGQASVSENIAGLRAAAGAS